MRRNIVLGIFIFLMIIAFTENSLAIKNTTLIRYSGVDLLTAGTPGAQSTYNEYVADFAVDNSVSTRWLSSNPANGNWDWWYNFGDNCKTANLINIYIDTGQGIKLVDLKGSNDSETFYTLWSGQIRNIAGWQSFNWSRTNCYKYYRFEINSSWVSSYVGIGEVELKYNSSMIFNTTLNISNINCSSSGDMISPYSTSDTTPTFRFTSNAEINCRIGNQNLSYAAMGSSRNCGTTGGTSHICTLGTQDELIYSSSSIYISCTYGMTNKSIKLLMNITDLQINHTRYMDEGIKHSVLGSKATIYNNQQIYLRNKMNQQVLAKVDRVVVYGNQRWIFNYNNLTTLGLFNISPVVYVLEMGYPSELPLMQIQSRVAALINATKR